ncbi:MAG: hypothetical protein ABEL97_15095 [Salinibacter sp.]
MRCLRLSVLAALLVGLVGACSGPPQLSGNSMAGRPAVDGSIEEWGGRLTPVDGSSVSVGAHPTDSLLYVALLVQDRALVRSLAVNGLVVWVDPSGGQRRVYGVQYPLGLRRQRAGQTQSAAVPKQPATSGQAAVGLDDVSLAELEVVRGDTARRRIPARFSSGLRGKAVLDPSSLIYEVAIPVGAAGDTARTHGLRTALSGSVGLGLEIPKPDEDEETTNQGENLGSVTGRRGRRRRRRRRRRRQRRQQQSSPQFETLNLWMTVPAEAQP